MPAANGVGLPGLSADSWIGVNEEVTYGTKVGPTSALFTSFLDETLTDERPLLEAPVISQPHHDVNLVFPGVQRTRGTVTVPYVYEGLEEWLLHALGEINGGASGASGTYTRNFDLADKGRWKKSASPGLSIHVSRGIVGSGATLPTVFSYLGCVVDTIEFECKKDDVLRMKVGVISQQVDALATSSVSVVLPTAPPAIFNEMVVTWGAARVPCSRFKVMMKRNLDGDRAFSGDSIINEPPPTRYDVVQAEVDTEWDNEVRAGSVTLRADYLARTQRELKAAFTSTGNIGATAQKYVTEISLPVAIISGNFPNVKQTGRIPITLKFNGYDSTVGTAPHELRVYQKNARNFTD